MISKPETIAASLNVPERLLLFCIATDSDWAGAGITNATVRIMQVINLIEREPGATCFTLNGAGTFGAGGARRSPEFLACRGLSNIWRVRPSAQHHQSETFTF
jgi:hypothetical protein